MTGVRHWDDHVSWSCHHSVLNICQSYTPLCSTYFLLQWRPHYHLHFRPTTEIWLGCLPTPVSLIPYRPIIVITLLSWCKPVFNAQLISYCDIRLNSLTFWTTSAMLSRYTVLLFDWYLTREFSQYLLHTMQIYFNVFFIYIPQNNFPKWL